MWTKLTHYVYDLLASKPASELSLIFVAIYICDLVFVVMDVLIRNQFPQQTDINNPAFLFAGVMCPVVFFVLWRFFIGYGLAEGRHKAMLVASVILSTVFANTLDYYISVFFSIGNLSLVLPTVFVLLYIVLFCLCFVGIVRSRSLYGSDRFSINEASFDRQAENISHVLVPVLAAGFVATAWFVSFVQILVTLVSLPGILPFGVITVLILEFGVTLLLSPFLLAALCVVHKRREVDAIDFGYVFRSTLMAITFILMFTIPIFNISQQLGSPRLACVAICIALVALSCAGMFVHAFIRSVWARAIIIIGGFLIGLFISLNTIPPTLQSEYKISPPVYTYLYECENGYNFTVVHVSNDRVHIVQDGTVVHDLPLSDAPVENYNDGKTAYTFTNNTAIVTQMGDAPRSTICHLVIDTKQIGTLGTSTREKDK